MINGATILPRQGEATISACGTYRYHLRRSLASPLRWVRSITFVMLNPSTADAAEDDPTIRKCVKFAIAWGGTQLDVVNLFALRATDPKELAQHPAPIGPENDAAILRYAKDAYKVVCAWGKHGALGDRGDVVAAMLRRSDLDLHYLALNKDGSPHHPLYLRDSIEPKVWG